MTEPRPTLAGHGEVLYWYCSKMDVAYAADESFGVYHKTLGGRATTE